MEVPNIRDVILKGMGLAEGDDMPESAAEALPPARSKEYSFEVRIPDDDRAVWSFSAAVVSDAQEERIKNLVADTVHVRLSGNGGYCEVPDRMVSQNLEAVDRLSQDSSLSSVLATLGRAAEVRQHESTGLLLRYYVGRCARVDLTFDQSQRLVGKKVLKHC